MVNDDLSKFRKEMMHEAFGPAEAIALSFKETAPRLSLFLQQCVWHERDGWAQFGDVPFRGPTSALSQSMATFKAEIGFRSGVKSVPSQWVLSEHKADLIVRGDWSEDASCLHLRADLANRFGLKSHFKKTAQALRQRSDHRRIDMPQIRLAYAKLFDCLVDDGRLEEYCDFLSDWATSVPAAFTGDFGTAITRARKDEDDGRVLAVFHRCWTYLLENPHTNPFVVSQIISALGKHSPNLDIAIKLGKEALERFDDHPSLNFWTARNDIAAVNLEAHDELIDRLEIAAEAGETDLFSRSAYYLGFTEIRADKLAAIVLSGIDKADLADTTQAPSVIRETKPDQLTLGLCSKFFFNHGIGHVLLNTLKYFGKYGLSPKLLSIAAENPSDIYSQGLIEHADSYFDVPPNQYSKIPQVMKSMAPDVFIDIDGYMTPLVQEIAKLRHAPLNAYWIGHGGRIGLPCYDYVVGDQFVTPSAEPKYYPEKEIRLPTSFVTSGVFDFDREAKHAEFGLPDDKFIFNCFNNFMKISPLYFVALEKIAKEVPNAVFWFNSFTSGPDAHGMVSDRLKGIGLAEDQIHFAARVEPKSKHYDRLALSDLALDTFTVNTSSGALDNLWAEVPTLTMPGDNYYNRICGSFNAAIGLEELNMTSLDEYVAKAVFLANNPGELARIKDLIAKRKAASSLFNPEKFAEEFAAGMWAAMERVWSGLPPEHIDVEV